MMKLIECIPNFSEGRRQSVIDSIVNAISSVESVYLLDVSSDRDHNRTVVTFAAPSETVGEAAFKGVATAVKFIDLEQHEGVHPRIGAADVVPFVPLQGATMDECVNIVHQLASRVAHDLHMPVYLYENASIRPERRDLATIRKHQYEALKSKILDDTDFAPDYGPHHMGKAGAVAIGARKPLIAFNIYLATSDVDIAKRIARKIRASTGGLPAVKALGLSVNGYAQVSMNLVDTTITSLFTVFQTVQQEAVAAQTTIHHSELIGLIPQNTLIESALQSLKLPLSIKDNTIEERLSLLTNKNQVIHF